MGDAVGREREKKEINMSSSVNYLSFIKPLEEKVVYVFILVRPWGDGVILQRSDVSGRNHRAGV